MPLQPLPTDFELTVPGNQKVEGDALIEQHLHVLQTASFGSKLSVADTVDATTGGLMTNSLQLSMAGVDVSLWPRLRANALGQLELQGSLRVMTDVTIEGALTVSSGVSISGNVQVVGTLQVSEVLEATAIHQNGQPLAGSRWDLVVGGINYAQGNVGIGTKQPVTTLEVVKDWTGEEGALRLTGDKPTIRFSGGPVSDNQTWILHQGSHGPGNLGFYRRTGPSAWNHVLSLTPGDNVGIGTISPGAKLHVAGDLRVDGSISGYIDVLHSSNRQYVLVMQNDRNLVLYHNGVGPVWASNTVVSDSNLKQGIKPISNALEKLLSVHGVSFAWKDETIRTRELGVLAQELEQVFPELVYSIDNHKLVKYHGLIPVLIEALKAQQNHLATLSAEVHSLKQHLV